MLREQGEAEVGKPEGWEGVPRGGGMWVSKERGGREMWNLIGPDCQPGLGTLSCTDFVHRASSLIINWIFCFLTICNHYHLGIALLPFISIQRITMLLYVFLFVCLFENLILVMYKKEYLQVLIMKIDLLFI